MSVYRVISPWYIVGLVDGEGSFSITIYKHNSTKLKKTASLQFQIELRADDRYILELVQRRLDCGYLKELNYERYGWKPHVKYYVVKQSDIFYKVIPFFKKFPLPGKKGKDFQLFCQAADLFKYKGHLTQEGIDQLYEIRKFMNDRRPMFG